MAAKEKTSAKDDLLKMLESISGGYSRNTIYSDWVECMALAISNGSQLLHNKVWHEREQRFVAINKKYSQKTQTAFCDMLGVLSEALEEKMEDVLGETFMRFMAGSKELGQFFTPYHISELVAGMAACNPDENGRYRVEEPSCGAGGMVIAAAAKLKRDGIDYQRKMTVVCQDLDWRSVYMCYVQLSLLGIRAIVVQGDTLKEPYSKMHTPADRILRTPMYMMELP